MSAYTPPFALTQSVLSLTAEIEEKTDRLLLRPSRPNRDSQRKSEGRNLLRSIYSTLAIEGNSLSPEEVEQVLSGQTVTAQEKEIQEVY